MDKGYRTAIVILMIIALAILYFSGSDKKTLDLPDKYKCATEKCYISDDMTQVNELRNSQDLVDEVLGPFFFKEMGRALASADCGKRCKAEGYTLFATDMEKVMNRLTWEEGYHVYCLCANLK